MRALFACFLLSAFTALSHAMTWPPGDSETGHASIGSAEMTLIWDRYDAASKRPLGKTRDLVLIQQIPLPHGAKLWETRWMTSRTAIGQASATFDSGATEVTYLIVFEKTWVGWRLRSYYTAIVACSLQDPNQPPEPMSGLAPGHGSS